MNVTPVQSVNPINVNTLQPAVQAVKQPLENLPQAAIPPVGIQGRPPIENIVTNPQTNPAAQTALPLYPVPEAPPSILAEMAATQEMQRKIIKDEQNRLKEKLNSSTLSMGEEALISEMFDQMRDQILETTRHVLRSAFKHVFKRTQWLNPEHAPEAEDFFLKKVPAVLTDELSSLLHEKLGLDKKTS